MWISFCPDFVFFIAQGLDPDVWGPGRSGTGLPSPDNRIPAISRPKITD